MYLFLLLSDWSLSRIDKRITGMTEKIYQSRDRQSKRDISERKIQKENKQTHYAYSQDTVHEPKGYNAKTYILVI